MKFISARARSSTRTSTSGSCASWPKFENFHSLHPAGRGKLPKHEFCFYPRQKYCIIKLLVSEFCNSFHGFWNMAWSLNHHVQKCWSAINWRKSENKPMDYFSSNEIGYFCLASSHSFLEYPPQTSSAALKCRRSYELGFMVHGNKHILR